ncbi:MAG: hypothetical protein V4633_24950 [Pseudomonadota bacterium]
MTRSISFIFLAMAGILCGAAVGLTNTAFVPNCGDDCAAQRLGNGTLWGLALMLVFPIVGKFAFEKIGEGLRQTVIIASLLFLATVVPAAAVYGYELHHRFWKSARMIDIPNVDFSSMAIATRPVSAHVNGATAMVQVNAWERCAFGYAACDRQSRTAEAICLGSGRVVLIGEADWPAFQRIEGEDLPRARGLPKDMKLCAANSP